MPPLKVAGRVKLFAGSDFGEVGCVGHYATFRNIGSANSTLPEDAAVALVSILK